MGSGQLLDVIEGRSAAGACAWLADQPQQRRSGILWAVLDLSGPRRLAFDTMLPDAAQVADPHLAEEFVERLSADLQDGDRPGEIRQLGRTIARWSHQIVAWRRAHATNGPTESANNLIKRAKRIAFGFRSFANHRIRSLLHADKPDWTLLATITPR